MYTAFAGPIIYAFFGSVRQITVGPTAVMALMTLEYTSKGGAPYAVVLSFWAGCLELLAGLFNFGMYMHAIQTHFDVHNGHLDWISENEQVSWWISYLDQSYQAFVRQQPSQ